MDFTQHKFLSTLEYHSSEIFKFYLIDSLNILISVDIDGLFIFWRLRDTSIIYSF